MARKPNYGWEKRQKELRKKKKKEAKLARKQSKRPVRDGDFGEGEGPEGEVQAAVPPVEEA
jgi:hypothetical protein